MNSDSVRKQGGDRTGLGQDGVGRGVRALASDANKL